MLLAAAAAMVVVFIVAQRQSADVSYGNAPATATITQGTTGVTLPSVEQMTSMVAANRVVRLPGAVAQWDQAVVQKAIGSADVRILVAPPGLTDAQRDEVYDVDNADVRVIGTRVAGGMVEATPSSLSDWRAQFARDDVTGLLVAIVNDLQHRPTEGVETPPAGTWRDPTAAELSTVAASLRDKSLYVAPGATLTKVPHDAARQAFGSDDALVVALPVQPIDTAAPDYGPALARMFPDRPLVIMDGFWARYYGPHAADFADVAAVSFYGQFGDLLSGYSYGQDNVLGAFLGQITGVRYAGLFDRPLPYRPFDPLHVALPVLPWLFAACVTVFLALSARSLRRPARVPTTRGVPARLAGLTALAVEVSALTDARTDPALARAITQLGAARKALHDRLPDQHVRELLDEAEASLDEVGSALDFTGYRPATYLAGRLA